jgi:plastocyanin domain-containing protein
MSKLGLLVVAASFAASTALAADKPAASAPQVVKLEVTSAGFVPAEVTVKKGLPVKLEVTRRTARTCATELVLKDKNIKLDLPLDKTVSVSFTPDKSGKLRYACAMDMIAGVIVVSD